MTEAKDKEQKRNEKPRKKWRRRLLRFLVFVLILLVAGWIGIDQIAPYAIISPERYNVAEHAEEFPIGILPEDHGLTYDEMDITVRDSAVMDGYYVHAQTDSARGCFLILHGIGSCKEPMLSLADKLSQRGFNVYLYDHRGHGQSGGEYISYGYYEKQDVKDILDALELKYGHQRYGIWGSSYGGAVALQAMGIERRLELGIIESTFSEMDKVVLAYQERILGISSKWLAERVLRKATAIANFDASEVKPVVSAGNIFAPVLMIHGTADANIPAEHSRDIFHELKSSKRELYLVEGADHYNLWSVGGAEYEAKVFAYIDANWP